MFYLIVSILGEVQNKHPPVGDHLEVVADKHLPEVVDNHSLAEVDKHPLEVVDNLPPVVVNLNQVVKYWLDTVRLVAEGKLLNITQLHTQSNNSIPSLHCLAVACLG